MKSPTVNYPRNASYPHMQRRRKRGTGAGCTCDGNYAKSLQGICKLFAIIIELLIIIIIGVSPYWKQIFVIGAVNWPFHIVMLITSLMFIATLFMYAFFLSEMHLSHPNIAWPNVELYFNITMSCFTLLAACLEAANVWRWDISQSYRQGFNANNPGGTGGFGVQGSQIFGGQTLSGSLNFNSYCARYPKDCQDYVALLTGNNTYFGNHVFGTILLFFLLICYLVSLFFAYRTWKVFRRDMTKDRPEGAPLPPPSAWERFRFRMSEIKVPKVNTDNIKERFTNLLRRDDEEEEGDVDISSHPNTDSLPPYSEKPVDRRSNHGSSTYKSSSSHHGRSSRHSRSSSDKHRDRRDDHDEVRSHRSSRHERSENGDRRSHRSGSESRSSKRRSEHRHRDTSEKREDSSKKRESSKKSSSKDNKADVEAQPLSPVASVMC